MNKPPYPPRVRVTVPVTEETLEAFQHYATSAGVSVGRAMGDWLAEQITAVTYAALRFEEVREELQQTPRAIAQAVVPVGSRRPGGLGKQGAARPTRPEASPRPVIRGGNSPERGKP